MHHKDLLFWLRIARELILTAYPALRDYIAAKVRARAACPVCGRSGSTGSPRPGRPG